MRNCLLYFFVYNFSMPVHNFYPAVFYLKQLKKSLVSAALSIHDQEQVGLQYMSVGRLNQITEHIFTCTKAEAYECPSSVDKR